jgi:hypothetical protein
VDLLHSAADQSLQFSLILGGHLDTQGWTPHVLSMCQDNSTSKWFFRISSRGHRPRFRSMRERNGTHNTTVLLTLAGC